MPSEQGLRRICLRLLSIFRPNQAEADLARELRAHLELLEDAFVERGMNRDDGASAARRAFGSVEQAKELQRDARSFLWLDSWRLDLKLGARLLVKYPGLSIVGGCAMTFGIAFGATAFEAQRQLVSPAIPLEEGEQIIGIRLRDAETTRIEPRVAHDVITWRTDLDIVEDVGAFRLVERNLAPEGGSAAPIEVAEISAAAFTLARVPPLMGRPLTTSDEATDAAAVVVIGHDVWRTRFAGDPHVVGRIARIGTSQPTIVGVMPEGFAFPMNQSVWTPLRLRAGEYPPRGGPALQVFGRLADGVSLERAQAALTTIGQHAAMAFPATHTHLRPEVLPHKKSMVDVTDAFVGFAVAHVFVVMFLLLVCANVGTLVFARAVTRHSEIVVRSALGATRGRIVMQLFAEALVLGGVAAVIGLAASRQILHLMLSVSAADKGRTLPFWMHGELSPATVFYTCALTVLAAVIAGAVPALKVTGRRLESRLRQSTLGDSSPSFGGMWTVVIIAQVAVTVAFPAAAFLVRQEVVGTQSLDVGFPAREYLSARLELDLEGPADLPVLPSPREDLPSHVRRTLEELQRRLSSEPLVAGVTFTDRLPRTVHPERWVEIEPLGRAASQPQPVVRASRASVVSNYFDVVGVPMLVGRSFGSSDSRNVVIVNRSFVDRMGGGRSPIGRRVRYAASAVEQASDWYEIVGVVKDLGTIHDDYRETAGIYDPVSPGELSQVHIAVHVKDDAASFAPRLRSVATAVDPALRLHDVMPLDAVGAGMWLEFDMLWRLLGVVSAIALLLSLAGIYSIMSFAVSRRTREIGVRVALGGDRWRVIGAVFARALAQLSLGIGAGGVLVFALAKVVAGLSLRDIAAIVIYVAVMMGVCLLACVVPTRRALRVQPTEALRAD